MGRNDTTSALGRAHPEARQGKGVTNDAPLDMLTTCDHPLCQVILYDAVRDHSFDLGPAQQQNQIIIVLNHQIQRPAAVPSKHRVLSSTSLHRISSQLPRSAAVDCSFVSTHCQSYHVISLLSYSMTRIICLIWSTV